MKKILSVSFILFLLILPLNALEEQHKQLLLQSINVEGELATISNNISAKNYQDALTDLRILLLVTENARIYFLYGEVNEKLTRPKLTQKAYLKTLPFKDVNPAMISKMGDYFSSNNLPLDAIKIYQKGAELFPENLGVFSRLGELHFQTQQYNKNIVMFEELLKRSPGLVNPVGYYLGLSYYAIEKDKKALQNFTAAADAGMEHADLFLKLGDLNAQQNNFRNGVKYYLSAEKMEVKEPQLYNNLGYCFLKLGENENALIYFIKARDAGYESEIFYKNFASIAFILKSYDELIKTIDPVYESMLDKKETAYYMARSCDTVGDREKALYYYQQSLDQGYNENIEYINERIEILSE